MAKLLESIGFPIDNWYPPARTPKKSLENPAFNHTGPTPVALEMLRARDEKDGTTNYRVTGVWSGKTKGRRGAFSTSLSSDVCNPTCVFDLQFEDVEALSDASNMQRFMLGLLDIWPAASEIEVGPFIYYTTHKVFPKRLGAGWMLYLPQAITTEELPEAAELMPVMEGDKQKGTIIVSVADAVFSVDNPEHVKIANAIEVRLADQGLLPL
ncbi:Imm52 family immunity protein [Trinickia fusca]|uniref:Imm52 family immunity protein n=1 Tax=Trinickia fusca TaxID=2419777 RepID=UPI001FE48D89|nr:Imm52 family immunity protein [Trinickia fusca]